MSFFLIICLIRAGEIKVQWATNLSDHQLKSLSSLRISSAKCQGMKLSLEPGQIAEHASFPRH